MSQLNDPKYQRKNVLRTWEKITNSRTSKSLDLFNSNQAKDKSLGDLYVIQKLK